MILILAEINLTSNNNTYSLAKVWVDKSDADMAEVLAISLLKDAGCTIKCIIENTTTTKDDYFPPCTSLDAFMLAEQDSIAVLYT